MASYDEGSVSSLVRKLPYKLQIRFQSLNGYVNWIIDEELVNSQGDYNLTSEDIQMIQFAALVYSLRYFFRLGTQVARDASQLFEDYNVNGFSVGSVQFTANNENTNRGEKLDRNLRAALAGTALGRKIQEADTMETLVRSLIKDFRNGQI